MKLLIISDVHGNLSALEAVLDDATRFNADSMALLGDTVDYGMRSNEVVSRIASINKPMACALWGNHEAAIMNGDYSRFSSPRGAECAMYTGSRLSDDVKSWLKCLPGKEGFQRFTFASKRFLAVHGSPSDPYWGTLSPNSVDIEQYHGVDVVLSGHNHVPHAFSLFAVADNPSMRNRRRIDFVNPGSVGQPRNHSPKTCYAIWDSERGVSLVSVDYPIEIEQSLYDGSVDDFYRARLELGI